MPVAFGLWHVARCSWSVQKAFDNLKTARYIQAATRDLQRATSNIGSAASDARFNIGAYKAAYP